MKCIKTIIGIVVLFSICSCFPNNQTQQDNTRANVIPVMQPNIVLSTRYDSIGKEMYDVIIIHNISDNRAYENYEIYINGIYQARLQRRPPIRKGDNVEIPTNIFFMDTGTQFPSGRRISSVFFEADGYRQFVKRFPEEIENNE